MHKIPNGLRKAILIRRINRFVAEVILNNEHINVYVPNTGRLSELAIPGSEILLSPINAKYKYKILYIISRSFPVMIDSTYSNRLFLKLLRDKNVPGIKPYNTVKSEPVYGNHRFDFLAGNDEQAFYIELKSCTLFYGSTGAFPDAVSSRASEHVKALAGTGRGKLIFFVLKNSIEKFIPNYHTDFEFYETLKFYQDQVDIHAYTVQYDENLAIQSLKEIPVIIPDVRPEGLFLMIFFNSSETISEDGEITEKGYYIYCGSVEKNVFKTISGIKRKNGIRAILPEVQFSKFKIVSDIPVITQSVTTTAVRRILINKGGEKISFYLQDDKTTDNGLIYFRTNPAEQSWFWDLILELRFRDYS